MQSLSNNKVYRKFVKQRDSEIEVILKNTLIQVDNILRDLFSRWVYSCMIPVTRTRKMNNHEDELALIRSLQNHMDSHMATAVSEISLLVSKMRKKVYQLTVASEAEAIARAFNKDGRYSLSELTIKRIIDSPAPTGGDFKRKIQYNLMNVSDKLKKTAHWIMMNPDVDERSALVMLIKKLPRITDLETKKRALKPLLMTEADKIENPFKDFATGHIDDGDWEDILDEYKKTIFVNRGPDEVFNVDVGRGSKQTPHYAWEMEAEITQDFVNQVRTGQIDAAKQNGIVEFVWIAVVDDKTDECCLWRDGLTTSEIERRLQTDKKNDECFGSVPPAHFNCRCQLAPATEDLPDTPASNEKDFDQWLQT